jgi:hypothetical protein
MNSLSSKIAIARVGPGGIQRLDDVLRVRQVQDPVVRQRRALVAAVTHRDDPGEAELVDVVAVYLIQGTVAPAIERSPPAEPVPVRRIGQHCGADGSVAVHCAVDEAGSLSGGFGDAAGAFPALRSGRRRLCKRRIPVVAEQDLADGAGGVDGSGQLRDCEVQHVGRDRGRLDVVERSRLSTRHGFHDQVVDRVNGLVSPLADKARAAQYRAVARALHFVAMTFGAPGYVDSTPGASVGRRNQRQHDRACGNDYRSGESIHSVQAISARWRPRSPIRSGEI